MDITLMSFGLGLLLLAVPLWLLHELQVPLLGKTLQAFGRVALWVACLGTCLYFVFRWDHWAVNVGAALLMVGVGAGVAVRRARLNGRYLVPVGAGMLAAVLVVGAWLLLLALGIRRPLDARYLLPVVGLLVGSMTAPLSQALSTYYAGLRHHDQLYYYLLGNGTSHGEALAWFVRRAMERSVAVSVRRVATIVLMASPVVIWAMLLSGVGAVEAVAVQLLLPVAGFSASVLALVVALYVARRYAFDEYLRLQPGRRMEGEKGGRMEE